MYTRRTGVGVPDPGGRPQQELINDAEHDRRRGDADGEDGDDHRGDAAIAAEPAGRVAEVGAEPESREDGDRAPAARGAR